MKILSFLCIAMLFLCSTLYADRTVWYVHPDSALHTIQAGLDSCSDNDIVLVAPGIYHENIFWPSSQGIHLVSELGPEVTIIDGDSAGSVIEITTGIDTATVIRGFTIQNGAANYGGGIHCGGGHVEIRDNVLQNNTATGGGAIFLIHAYAVILGNTLTSNLATSWSGGGIHVAYMAGATIHDNVITYNEASGYGGGIHIGGGMGGASSADISYNTIEHNTASVGGGISAALWIISHNVIRYNQALEYGGGINLSWGAENPFEMEVSDNTIDWNTALIAGGGVTIRGSYPFGPPTRYILRNSISYNVASTGAGIYYFQACSTYIDSCTISNNVVDGITCDSIYRLDVNFCNISGNSGYGIRNLDTLWTYAENVWWGNATGPYHPSANPNGLGDTVSDYVTFDPWLSWPVGVYEEPIVRPGHEQEGLTQTIFSGPLRLPEGKKCKVIDIAGRVVEPTKIQAGIYFIEVDGVVTQKVVKVR
jgi:hypothetical protein